ncbi:MAG: hypothetical protein SPK63_03395 [Eubacteriales bacterium]|nr:hypothetical protein [Eubacteriales bacterium]
MTKKKSIWAVILALMLFVPTMFLFSACGKHKHSFSSDWSKSETQHWHDCTDKNCNEKQDLADHDFVWTEKTPAGVHTDKVETGTCSTCQYQKDRTIEGSGANIHSWERKSDATKHWEQTTCTQHDTIKRNEEAHTWEWKTSDTKHWQEATCEQGTQLKQNEQDHTWERKSDATKHWEQTTCTQHDTIKRNEDAHTWEWKANEHKHWQETTCEHETPLKQNEQDHTWKYESEGELTHRRTTNCGAEKHPSRTEIKIPHRYTGETDVDCNDCGYVRSLTGKGSFNAITAKTYNAGAQGVALSDYTVDEKIKDLCEIQYKVKGANDSTYTTTAPTNAGTYEVRIYCEGNDTYLKGEVAKAEYVINKYEVEIVSGLTFNVAYDKAAMEDANVEYIHLGTVNVTDGLDQPVDVPIKAKKKDAFKNPGRYQVYDDEMLIEDDNFALKKLTDLRKVNLVYYNDSVVATLTSDKDESKIKWDATKKQVGITVVRVNNGTIRVGDYMMCEGYTKPLKVVALKLQYNVPTDMLINADKNCEIYFDNSSFADLATAKPILANKTFTEVETLNFIEGEDYTNTVSRKLNKGECFYLAFTTEASTPAKTYKLNFDTSGTGYETSGSVYFFGTNGTTASIGNDLTMGSEGIYFVKVTKTADSEPGKESVDFSIKKW